MPRAAALARGSGVGLAPSDDVRAERVPCLENIETTPVPKIKILHLIIVFNVRSFENEISCGF